MIFVENHEIFPVLVTIIRNFINIDQCNIIFDNYARDNTQKKHKLLIGDTTSNFNNFKSVHKEINDLEGCFDFNDKLENIINRYSGSIGIIKTLTISNSWINIQNENSMLKKHTHPNSVVSGALYLNVNERSSNLYFHNPNPFLQFMELENSSMYSMLDYRVSPRKGDLVLFPSWLSHSSNEEINQTKNRMVFSFNTNCN